RGGIRHRQAFGEVIPARVSGGLPVRGRTGKTFPAAHARLLVPSLRCRMSRLLAVALLSIVLAIPTPAAPATQPWEKAVAEAAVKKPMTADEAGAFAMKLAKYVAAHHLKTDPNSPQRGMVYEYFDTTRAGQIDQWVQGEALDTMH